MSRRLESCLLPRLLDRPVATAEGVPSEVSRAARLWPREQQAIARAVATRRAQYSATRHLARQLFRSFGLPEAPILNREDRSPIWPQGYTGSITHTALWCGVAFAPLSAVRSVGIDAEAAERLDPKVAERVLTTREWQRISEAGHHPPEFAALWFSAKESVYKCVFPIVRRFIGFTEVEIHVSIADGTFRAEPVGAQLEAEHGVTVRQLRGRFLSTDALWLTSATLDS